MPPSRIAWETFSGATWTRIGIASLVRGVSPGRLIITPDRGRSHRICSLGSYKDPVVRSTNCFPVIFTWIGEIFTALFTSSWDSPDSTSLVIAGRDIYSPYAGEEEGGYYWSPSSLDDRTAWTVQTCHDLGCDPEVGHVDLWPAVVNRLAAVWGELRSCSVGVS